MHDSLDRPWQLYRLRRYPQALEETTKFLAHHPESSEAHCLLALLHGKEKRQKQAVEAAEKAIQYRPDGSYPHYVHGLVNYWFDKYHPALKSLSEALRLHPDDPDIYEIISAIHAGQGHYKTSLSTAEKGLERQATHVGCTFQRANALFMLNRMQQAEQAFNETLALDPDHAEAQGYLGHFLVQQGKHAEAVPLLMNALRDNPYWSLAQDAWREALRTQNRFYGWLIWFKQNFLLKRVWLTMLILWIIVSGIIFACFDIDWQGRLVVTVLLGPFLTPVVFLSLIVFVGLVLKLMNAMLFFWNRDLRRNYKYGNDWVEYRRNIKADIPFFVIVILVIIGALLYQWLAKPGP